MSLKAKSIAIDVIKKRMQSDVRRDGDCLIWMGAKAGAGYGFVTVNDGDLRKNFYVHRLVCELETGQVGEIAMHSCDRPDCVNPSHLRWGTRSENTRDMINKNRHGTHMRVHPNRSLTWRQVKEIRSSNRTLRAIATEYGIHHSQVHLIKKGRLYKTRSCT